MRSPSRRRLCRLALALPALATTASAAADQRVALATAGLQSDYHPIGVAVCRMVNATRKRHGLRCIAELSAGSVANIEAVLAGSVALGLAQGDMQVAARNGTGPFAGAPRPRLRALFNVAPELFTAVVSAQSNLRSIADLKGKRVSLGPPGSGTRATSDIVLAAHDLRAADLAEAVELKFVELAPALCEHKIDAFLFVAGHPNPVFLDATAACGARFIGLADDRLNALLAGHAHYRRAQVPIELYRGQSAPVLTVATTAGLVADEGLPDEIAYTVTRSVFENLADFRRMQPALAGMTGSEAVQTLLPLHPGAEAYFREVGLLAGR